MVNLFLYCKFSLSFNLFLLTIATLLLEQVQQAQQIGSQTDLHLQQSAIPNHLYINVDDIVWHVMRHEIGFKHLHSAATSVEFKGIVIAQSTNNMIKIQ